MSTLHNYNKVVKGQPSEDDFINWLYEHSAVDAEEIDIEKAWEKCKERTFSPSNSNEKIRNFPSLVFKIAATLLLLAVLGYFINSYFNDTSKLIWVASQLEKKEIKLPDGSQVILNKNSELAYAENFTSQRNVTLKGEAYFKVVKNDNPFRIKVQQLNIEVLGTAFNVKSTPTETSVFVEEGKVSLSHKKKKVIITKGEMVAFSKTNNQLLKQKSIPLNLMSWRHGIFVFEDTPLKDVLAQLSAYYNKIITSSPPIENCKITAEFKKMTYTEVLNVLCTILPVDILEKREQILLNGTGCN